jgi:sensor histidine kinase regulating citrate/malate metabolism
LVYLGVLLVQNSEDNAIKTVMFGVLGVITVVLGVWIFIKMNKVKKVLLDEQEQRSIKKAETVEMVPNVRSAFERRYDDVEPTEWTMVPTQPARML